MLSAQALSVRCISCAHPCQVVHAPHNSPQTTHRYVSSVQRASVLRLTVTRSYSSPQKGTSKIYPLLVVWSASTATTALRSGISSSRGCPFEWSAHGRKRSSPAAHAHAGAYALPRLAARHLDRHGIQSSCACQRLEHGFSRGTSCEIGVKHVR
ncbi:hypothetical protein OH76DRAFT_465727 [Lentinus brumalis]|uniref:Uncharacterized protein n=1 Tax=Lentinus brumalis TaxID=2498619 RepID=A0A371DCI6_9APHY|nr:hypothetical protein OH76DRAFT_465727 [Polyporus brumalis]